MKLDISPDEFNEFSGEQKKKYIAQLFIRKSGAVPTRPSERPIAVITAGLPGAGKTEFLDTLAGEITATGSDSFVRIDLDEIVSVYPDYTPKDDYKFRSQGNVVLERTIDQCVKGRYNMLIDGTFSSPSGASIRSVERLLRHDYIVIMVYIYDTADSAWHYTKKRKIDTGRSIDKEDFIESAKGVCRNVRSAVKAYRDNPAFSISAVIQKDPRDREYYIITEKSDVDNIVSLDYNLEKIKKS